PATVRWGFPRASGHRGVPREPEPNDAAADGCNMPLEIGRVEAIYRYPVKSMGGGRLETAKLGRHGIECDRRLALRRLDDKSGFPWLSASKLPDLLLFTPHREDSAQGEIPTHVRTP